MNDKLIEVLLEIIREKGSNDKEHPFFEVGKQYFIRTVTNYALGTVKYIDDKNIILEAGSKWIADTGRLYNSLVEGFESQDKCEFETMPCIRLINPGSIVDATPYSKEITAKQK